MSNERPDEFLEWRAQLGQPDALPGIGLQNREASWQKLTARMRTVRRPKYRYAVAAALLLLTLTSIAFLFRGRNQAVAGRTFLYGPAKSDENPNTVKRLEGAGSTVALTLDSHSSPAVNTRSSSRVVAKINTANNKNKEHPSHALPLVKSGNADTQTPAIPAVIDPLPPPPVVQQIAQTTVPHKQLKIVCLNEIDKAVPQAPALSSNYSGGRNFSGSGLASFRIKVSLPIFTSIMENAPEADAGRSLKFTISPKNH